MAKWLSLILAIFSVIDLSMACNGMDVLSKQISCDDKKKILAKHNTLRMTVATGKLRNQPPAMNMLRMTWDEELAMKAQKLADRCTYAHDTHNDRKDIRFYVGQNLALTVASTYPTEKPEFDNAIQSWYDENKFYMGQLAIQSGHFTQLIWANTYMVGCGYSYFRQSNKYAKLYVCNYGPAGNILEREPYVQGSGCNKTGLKTVKKYPGLCKYTNQKKYNC